MKAYTRLNITAVVNCNISDKQRGSLIVCDDETYDLLLSAGLIVDEEKEFTSGIRPVVFLGDEVQSKNSEKLMTYLNSKEEIKTVAPEGKAIDKR